ncbi:LysR family transcriptional regulator [Rhizobium laguerreae]|uniref:LysR family transcriptional regulator n=1 Tax=Rhizobium laguerreae TaxID=1076926 RepID=UPI001C91D45F|nr:LysR family transcriptional regulator [Rhizobium laguerreae]MBY3308155.1 LysR family transcriptional regulator [Rhizobium laguerreae]
MRNLSIDELQSIAALARRRSFRAAAHDVGVSPTVLSQRIAASEEKLGVRLFNRTTRSVSPTEAGSQFFSEIEPALSAIAHAVDTVNEHRVRPVGRLKINSSVGAARRVLNSVILEFSRRYESIEIDLVTEDRLIDIVADGFDAGIRPSDAVPKDMIALSLEPNQKFSIVGSPEYLKGRPTPVLPQDLMQHQCLRSRLPSGGIEKWEFLVHGQMQRLEVPGSITLDDAGLMLEAALSGVGLAYLANWWTEPKCREGRLVAMLGEFIPPVSGLSLYYPSRKNQSAALQALINFISQEIQRRG